MRQLPTLTPASVHVSTERSPGRRVEEYRLPDGEAPAAGDRAVDPRLVVPHANDRLQHLRGRARRVGIEVDHRAAFVAIGDADGGGLGRLSERENASDPFVLLERERARGRDEDVGTESPDLRWLRRQP